MSSAKFKGAVFLDKNNIYHKLTSILEEFQHNLFEDFDL